MARVAGTIVFTGFGLDRVARVFRMDADGGTCSPNFSSDGKTIWIGEIMQHGGLAHVRL